MRARCESSPGCARRGRRFVSEQTGEANARRKHLEITMIARLTRLSLLACLWRTMMELTSRVAVGEAAPAGRPRRRVSIPCFCRKFTTVCPVQSYSWPIADHDTPASNFAFTAGRSSGFSFGSAAFGRYVDLQGGNGSASPGRSCNLGICFSGSTISASPGTPISREPAPRRPADSFAFASIFRVNGGSSTSTGSVTSLGGGAEDAGEGAAAVSRSAASMSFWMVSCNSAERGGWMAAE